MTNLKKKCWVLSLTVYLAVISLGSFGCDDDSDNAKDNKTNKTSTDQCKDDKDCAEQKDGKTHCDTDKKECVAPAGPVEEKTCGNGEIDGDEVCDKLTFKDDKTSCAEWDAGKYDSGDVKCKDDCTLEFSACVARVADDCGNDALDDDEECDTSKFKDNKTTCAAWDSASYASGNVKCGDNCSVDYTSCVPVSGNSCGNGKVDNGELCDGIKFQSGRTNCKTWNPEKYRDGKVTCNDDCTLNYGACVEIGSSVCNNGKVEGDELCDGVKFKSGRTNCKTWDPELYSAGKVKGVKYFV